MHVERTKDLGRAIAALFGALSFTSLVLPATPAHAEPGDAQAQRGLLFARRRNCVKAIPLLEEAEKIRHRPSTAVPLADCYVASGELIKASKLLHRVTLDKPERFWMRGDYNARKAAEQKAAAVDARIPSVRFEAEREYVDLEIEIDGRALTDPTAEQKVAPAVAVHVVARAKGRKALTDSLTLHEGERLVVSLHLEPLEKKPPAPPEAPLPRRWLGVRYYGVILPKFVMNLVADGGTNLVAPGGAFTFTTAAGGNAEVTVALGYLSFRMGDTPFKPRGEPDTEWEITSSTLQGLTATVDLMWLFPLDQARRASFRIGGAAGFGWMFLGDLSRVQAYPKNGVPGDPSTYLKCRGPNDPRGTFRYCNALDKDANHYPGFSEPDWFHHGIRPSVFPWIVLPQLGFTFRPSRRTAIDLDTGVSIAGFLTSLGVRFGL